MEIKFTAIVGATKKPKGEVSIGEEFQAYAGDYVMRELSAYEGNQAIDTLIAGNEEFQENPEKITPLQLQKKQIEQATTLNGKPLVIADLNKLPNKLWQILVAANETLNSVTLEEARFLLSPSA